MFNSFPFFEVTARSAAFLPPRPQDTKKNKPTARFLKPLDSKEPLCLPEPSRLGGKFLFDLSRRPKKK
jgi:hypothetical protein